MPTIDFPLPEDLAGLSLYAACCSPAIFVPFWRRVLSQLSAAGLADYRLKIKCGANAASFSVSAATGKEHKAGPRSFPCCLSCDPGVATIAENNFEGGESGRGPPGGLPPHLRGLTSGACEWSVEADCGLPGYDARLARVWLDAQARPLMIVTPRRHAGGMHEMDDAEVGALWEAVGAALALEWRPADASCNPGQPALPPAFSAVVLNVGRFRNIEHAHVKVWFDPPDFLERVERWPPSKRRLQADLQELRRLMKLPSMDSLATMLALAGDSVGRTELLVRGVFVGAADEAELRAAFGRHGEVVSVTLADPRFGTEGAVVAMAKPSAAASAVVALNLTRFGSNVMCKVKPAAALLAARAEKSGAA